MLIHSQDKKKVINLNLVDALVIKGNSIDAYGRTQVYTLGHFKTREHADEELSLLLNEHLKGNPVYSINQKEAYHE